MNPKVCWSSLTLILVLAAWAPGQVPQLINYQGRLEENGQPINGTRQVAFLISTDSAGLNNQWSEVFESLPITNGQFSVLLGGHPTSNSAPLDSLLTLPGAKWLGVRVGATELIPRSRLTSVPFALRATSARTADTAAIASVALVRGQPVTALPVLFIAFSDRRDDLFNGPSSASPRGIDGSGKFINPREFGFTQGRLRGRVYLSESGIAHVRVSGLPELEVSGYAAGNSDYTFDTGWITLTSNPSEGIGLTVWTTPAIGDFQNREISVAFR